jgi:hypothetical protein
MYAFKRQRREDSLPVPKARPALTIISPPAQTFPADAQPIAPTLDDAQFRRPAPPRNSFGDPLPPPHALDYGRPPATVMIDSPEGAIPAPPMLAADAARTRPRLVEGVKATDFNAPHGDALAGLAYTRRKLQDAGDEAPRGLLRRFAEGALRSLGSADPRAGLAGMLGSALGGGGISAAMPQALDNIHRREDMAGIDTQIATANAERAANAELADRQAQVELRRAQTGEITGRPARDAARADARRAEIDQRFNHSMTLLDARGRQRATQEMDSIAAALMAQGADPEEARNQAAASVIRNVNAGIYRTEASGRAADANAAAIPARLALTRAQVQQRREQFAQTNRISIANYEQRVREHADRVRQQAQNVARQNARLRITYEAAQRRATHSQVDLPDYLDILRESGVEVTGAP